MDFYNRLDHFTIPILIALGIAGVVWYLLRQRSLNIKEQYKEMLNETRNQSEKLIRELCAPHITIRPDANRNDPIPQGSIVICVSGGTLSISESKGSRSLSDLDIIKVDLAGNTFFSKGTSMQKRNLSEFQAYLEKTFTGKLVFWNSSR